MAPERTSVRGVGALLHLFPVNPGHVRNLPSRFPDHDIGFHGFPITNISSIFVVLVFSNGGFVDEHVLSGIIPVYETITSFDVIQLHGS